MEELEKRKNSECSRKAIHFWRGGWHVAPVPRFELSQSERSMIVLKCNGGRQSFI